MCKNIGTISNLPDACVAEVTGYVDGNGISISKMGNLPMGAAAPGYRTIFTPWSIGCRCLMKRRLIPLHRIVWHIPASTASPGWNTTAVDR